MGISRYSVGMLAILTATAVNFAAYGPDGAPLAGQASKAAQKAYEANLAQLTAPTAPGARAQAADRANVLDQVYLWSS